MKKKIADQWIEALRSGKYKALGVKEKGELKFRDAFDPLGVLCDIAPFGTWNQRDGFETPLSENGAIETSHFLPPDCVLQWAGLKSGDPEFNYWANEDDEEITTASISELFDEFNESFEFIADLIEEHYDRI